MQVVEGPHQADVLGKQHAVAEHVARHVAAADAGEVLVLDVLAPISRKCRLTDSQAPRAVMPIFLWS